MLSRRTFPPVENNNGKKDTYNRQMKQRLWVPRVEPDRVVETVEKDVKSIIISFGKRDRTGT